jgi:tRNA pseudouridine55 synthase
VAPALEVLAVDSLVIVMLHGFLNIDKPPGMTSHDVVARVRRVAGQKRVGHAGTLDPAATGVLPIALGQATRLVEYLADARKGYRATIALGVRTETDDAEGAVVERRAPPPLDAAALESVLAHFQGPIMQVPPAYSALHHQGKRLYELARAGVAPEIAARPVTIDSLSLLDWTPPLLEVEVVCGKGTYIRALARDIGEQLGCGAHLARLTRTFVGRFGLDTALGLDALTPEALQSRLLPPALAVAEWPQVAVSAEEARALRNGQRIPQRESASFAAAYGPDGMLVALLEPMDASWRPAKVFAWE